MPRRTAGSLIPLEREILEVALAALQLGEGTFHGFAIAQRLRARNDARSLTAHGTLYKALGRLEEFGLLRSRWETEGAEGRPRRRLYELTAEGARNAGRARAGEAAEAHPPGLPDARVPRVVRGPA
jgi:DNA-binding PadR family transcriptional regulator